MKPVLVALGGSFNPPTTAHFLLAEQIDNDYEIDKLLFVSVGDRYVKKGLLPSLHRVEMLRRACVGNDRFDVSTVEVESATCLTTIETLKLLQQQYPQHEIWFVMGADNLLDFPNWNDYEEILATFKLLVMERGDRTVQEIIHANEVLTRYESNIMVMNEEVKTTCSSTIVRNRIHEGKRVRFLVPESVNAYITENHLYL
ncbi:nicotinate (nicotinamide) nucleotide adenylyltransferase (plasmid) [Aneurinibacillus sp. Ricciae_BoGa-3]|uniref:nicotinate (nicotinamide) nucleotide adenylyltransferase n=1 Tax=Aneurinibacillus sp. Ricciae_BoGa-3 TaxID=3022697 RepID=UPI002341DB45|nr:nicotinate (nicotinamide) nucleotide adenylyltransferase [Aneurinibacillus sp. Ricciae_BoGa-3]WCK57575.1 nicotinate (nicotinamide) nucleotide adenylyltransferase [Aneurinibacillus sp. Ricciae_BoGa-3]